MAKEKPLTEIRTVYPFALFWSLANTIIGKAQKAVNPFDECLIGILCLAFSLEAYLNLIGLRRFRSEWKEFERKKPKDKLIALCNLGNFQPNFGARPFQAFKEIFAFRNSLVHGTVEVKVKGSYQIVKTGEFPKFVFPLTKWEKMVTPKKAKQLLLDAEKLIKVVHEKAGFADDPFKLPRAESSIYQYDSKNL